MLKNIFTWILMAAIALTLTYKVVTRPHPPAVPTHAAVIVAAPEGPKTYTEFREAHEPAEQPPAPAKAEQPKAAIEHHRGHAKLQPKAAPKRVQVKPDNGGAPVGLNCVTVKGYVDKFGRDRVKSGAQNYGYSEDDAERALKACGL